MMLFRSVFIIACQAVLLASVPTASASPVPAPQLFNWLHVMAADVPSSLLPTSTPGVTIQLPSGTETGNNDPAVETAALAAATSAEVTPTAAAVPQSNGAFSALAFNNKLALGSGAIALAFLAL